MHNYLCNLTTCSYTNPKIKTLCLFLDFRKVRQSTEPVSATRPSSRRLRRRTAIAVNYTQIKNFCKVFNLGVVLN
jgi:hypothetical protein